ncbi:MAG: hypothetical protein CR967_01445 [Proteobacteria bacterium]|nr:MAG: hypothetical protein CR967_01445 [Pseudomonadota bacterium]
MDKKNIARDISSISLSMFRKNFLGIFHGSISARVEHNKFLINKSDAIFDRLEYDGLIELGSKKDYRWHEASIDAHIHFNIYKNISEAKFICYAMPPFITAYIMSHDVVTPRDYFGSQKFGTMEVYDPKNFDDWYERADVEIPRYMKEKKTNTMVIRGYGIYTYDRNIHEIAKSVAILENSCRLLHYSKQHSNLIR